MIKTEVKAVNISEKQSQKWAQAAHVCCPSSFYTYQSMQDFITTWLKVPVIICLFSCKSLFYRNSYQKQGNFEGMLRFSSTACSTFFKKPDNSQQEPLSFLFVRS